MTIGSGKRRPPGPTRRSETELARTPARQRLHPRPHPPAPPRRGRLLAFIAETSASGRLPAFLLAVGLTVLLVAFLLSGTFNVRSVIVHGNQLTYADSIVAASGAIGASVFRLDSQQVAERIAHYPAVASADVSIEFPDRVVIHVHERVPAIVWQVGSKAVLVDPDGWVIATGYDPKLPRVIQEKGVLPKVGSQFPAGIVTAVDAIRQQLGSQLSTLAYDQQHGLTAFLSDGRSVIFGNQDQVGLKLSVLKAAMALPDHWSKLDVSEPQRPYYQ